LVRLKCSFLKMHFFGRRSKRKTLQRRWNGHPNLGRITHYPNNHRSAMFRIPKIWHLPTHPGKNATGKGTMLALGERCVCFEWIEIGFKWTPFWSMQSGSLTSHRSWSHRVDSTVLRRALLPSSWM
jgi:hypothetical protein